MSPLGLLLVFLAQATAPEKPADEHVEAFLKGSEPARLELIKLGPYAIRPLLKARDKARKVNELLFEIKRAAAYPPAVELLGRFENREGLMQNRQWTDSGALTRLFVEKGIPLFTDQFEQKHLTSTRGVVVNPATRLQLLEFFCQETGLDYGFFHNSVVIGNPERLWPDRKVRVTYLNEAEKEQARDLIRKLEDDSIEVRESASRRLIDLGTGVLPLIELQRKEASGELAARYDAISRVVGRASIQFGPPACARQKLAADEQAILKRLAGTVPKLALENAPLSDVIKSLGADSALGDGHARILTTVHSSGQSGLDLLSLVTQCNDLDFLVVGGKIVIDTRSAIETRLSQSR